MSIVTTKPRLLTYSLFQVYHDAAGSWPWIEPSASSICLRAQHGPSHILVCAMQWGCACDVGRPVMIATLHIQLLGGFNLYHDGTAIASLEDARLQALLASLVIQRHTPQSRQRLASQLYPNSTAAQARTNLRSTLRRLSQILPNADRFLEISAQTVQWPLIPIPGY